MSVLIIMFGGIIFLAGVLLLRNPEIIFGFLRNNIANSAIHVIAVMVRLIVGALLITQSSLSKFPLTIEVLGWVFIVAGVSLALIGLNKFRKLMHWAIACFRPYGRFTGAIAMVFGGFLVYAFL